MLQVSISVSSPTVHQPFQLSGFKFGKGYRVFLTNASMIHLPTPGNVMEDFHHYFEHVGAKRDQTARKRALSKIVAEAYECALGNISANATEEMYVPYKDTEMTFKVTPRTKALFLKHFVEPNKTKHSKGRWRVLSSLVMCAWMSAKQSSGKAH